MCFCFLILQNQSAWVQLIITQDNECVLHPELHVSDGQVKILTSTTLPMAPCFLRNQLLLRLRIAEIPIISMVTHGVLLKIPTLHGSTVIYRNVKVVFYGLAKRECYTLLNT